MPREEKRERVGSGRLAGEEESAELRVLSAELRKKLAVGSGQLAGERSGEFWERKGWGGGWFIIFR